jgi:hypothetical protein
MTDWTNEEEEAFNDVEKHSNLGKQILQAQGQPYHWEADAIKAAVLIEREACAKVCETLWNTQTNGMATEEQSYGAECAEAIRARGQA